MSFIRLNLRPFSAPGVGQTMNRFFLQQGYDLSNQDYIRENREGRIHPDQKAIFGHSLGRLFLRPMKSGSKKPSSLAIAVLVVFGLLFAGVKLFETDLPQEYKYLGAALLGFIFLVGVAYWAFKRFSRMRVDKEIETGSIEQGMGKLAFGKRNYEVKVKDRRLKLPFDGVGTLALGVEYRFYYLPKSGMVLSAQQLSTTNARDAQESLTKILARANGFKLDVLEENRQGRLAAKQILHLFGGILIALFFILVLVYFILPVYRPYFAEQNWRELSTVSMIFGLIVVAVIFYVLYLFINSCLDIAQMRVLRIDGIGHPFMRKYVDTDSTTTIDYYYKIGSQKFKVTKKGYAAMLQGLKYRGYYTPHRKKLVNIEALESPPLGAAQERDFIDRLENYPGIRIPKKRTQR